MLPQMLDVECSLESRRAIAEVQEFSTKAELAGPRRVTCNGANDRARFSSTVIFYSNCLRAHRIAANRRQRVKVESASPTHDTDSSTKPAYCGNPYLLGCTIGLGTCERRD